LHWIRFSIYSQIPLKDGLHRAPEFLTINALYACACAVLLGAWAGSKAQAIALAFAAAIAPALYVIALALAVPVSALLAFAWRKSR
jgi:hypothetical protein